MDAVEERTAVTAVDVTSGAGWRDDFTLRFATINGLPDVIVDGPEGPVQTAAFEIDGDVIRALYLVRNPDTLRQGRRTMKAIVVTDQAVGTAGMTLEERPE